MAALAAIISILSQALTVVPAGVALYQKFQAQLAQAQAWQQSGHIPTDSDWAALDNQVATDLAAVNAATRQS
jgi:hypothetical protein